MERLSTVTEGGVASSWSTASGWRLVLGVALMFGFAGSGVRVACDAWGAQYEPAAREHLGEGRTLLSGTGTPAIEASIEVIAHAGHVGGVSRAEFFPGGERLITTGWSGDLRVWDNSNGALIGLYRAHEHRVNAMAVSPSGTQFVSGDVGGNLMLWSFGSPQPRKLATHGNAVRKVAFLDENAVLSLSYSIEHERNGRTHSGHRLIRHELLRDEGRTVSLPAGTPAPKAMTFVGSRYVLLIHRESGEDRGLMLDIETLNPIAHAPLHEDVIELVLDGAEVWPWGASHLVMIDNALVEGASLIGTDLHTGNLLEVVFYGAGSCSGATVDLFAVDELSGKLAFATDYRLLVPDGDPSDTIRLAAFAPYRAIVDGNDGSERPVEDEGRAIRVFADDHQSVIRILSDLGGIQDIRREVPAMRSIGSYLASDDVPPATLIAGSRTSGLLPEELTRGIQVPKPSVGLHPFVLEHDYRFGQFAITDGERTVQDLGVSDSLAHCGASECQCSSGTGVGVMSVNARWVAGSAGHGLFKPSLWLYQDVESIRAAQSALRKLGYLGGVSGVDVNVGYMAVGEMDEAPRVGSIVLESWFTDGERKELDHLWSPYDIGGDVSWAIYRAEGGAWEGDSGPLSVRKTRLGRTVEALLRFQAHRGLMTTGVLDGSTRDALGLSGELAAPRKGEGRWLWYNLPTSLRKWHFDQGVAFARDDSRMAFARGSKVYVLDLRSGRLSGSRSAGVENIRAVEFASDDELLVLHSFGVVTINLETGATGTSYTGELAGMGHLRVYDDGNAIHLEGREISILAQRSARGERFEEVVRVRRTSEEDWVAVTPAGYFAGSSGLSRGLYLRAGARVLALDQFYETLYRPDLVREKLAGDPHGAYSKAASALRTQNLGRMARSSASRESSQ